MSNNGGGRGPGPFGGNNNNGGNGGNGGNNNNNRNGRNSRNDRGFFSWFWESLDSQWEAFLVFLLFEVFNVLVLVGAPIIWPTYGIFILITLFDITAYWEERNNAVRWFSFIPDVYWYMFAKFFLIDYIFDLIDYLDGEETRAERAASNAATNMW